jgi:hypothetical protein
MTLIDQLKAAHKNHDKKAQEAFKLLRSWYTHPIPRVPGMDTVIRLALRISRAHTIEEAAAKEYVYRWHLAIKAPDQVVGSHFDGMRPLRYGGGYSSVSILGAPHTIGM